MNGTRPTVTVIIPARNAAATIGACLDSIAELSPSALDVVVADDASTDGTGEIAAARGAVVVRLERNVGTGLARNAAARRSQGDYLAFTDADCMVPRDWLEKFVAAMADPRYSAATGAYAGTTDPRFLPRLIDYYLRYSQQDLHGAIESSFGSNLCVPTRDFFEAGGFPDYRLPGAPVGCFTNEDEEFAFFLVRRTGKPLQWLRDNGVFHAYRPTLPKYFVQQAKYAESIMVSYARFPCMMKGNPSYYRGRGASSVLSAWLAIVSITLAPIRPVFLFGVAPFFVLHTGLVRYLFTVPPHPSDRLWMGFASYPFMFYQSLAWSKGLLVGAFKAVRGWCAWKNDPPVPPPLAR